jgi:hypothetical protein
VKQIEISDATAEQLQLLADGWHTTLRDALARLVYAVATGATLRLRRRPEVAPVGVHNRYRGTRTDATFEPDTHLLTIRSGLLSGQSYTSPSAARRAVVAVLNPAVSPAGNGWDFWTITVTGAKLRTLRPPTAAGAGAGGGGDRS